MPYNDAKRWLFSHLDVGIATILNDIKVHIASLKTKGTHTRCQLPKCVSPMNKDLFEALKEECPVMFELIQYWWEEGVSFTQKDFNLYLIQHMKEPYQFLSSMICKLYGEDKCTHFKLEWTPIAHYVSDKGDVFNWEQLLSINISETTKGALGPKQPGFFMSSYLLDVVCASNHFPGMDWCWNPTSSPIHVYCF